MHDPPAAATSPPTDVPLWIVDAFADRPYTGNPAAVCLLPRCDTMTGWPDAEWMQRVADEMNLSETAFVLPPDPKRPDDPTFGLRWFTPKAEVELCGHATLASAHVLLYEHDNLTECRVDFATRYAGVLTCQTTGDAIAMDFPAQRSEPVEPPDGLLEALRLPADAVAAISYGPYDFLVELKQPEEVLALEPNFAALAAFDARGVAVTAAVPHDHARAKSLFRDAAVVSRFFAPRLRVAEDPVTGSLHCVLATYWSKRLDTNHWRAYQASRRGGVLDVEWRGDRVALAGRAITTLRGRLA